MRRLSPFAAVLAFLLAGQPLAAEPAPLAEPAPPAVAAGDQAAPGETGVAPPAGSESVAPPSTQPPTEQAAEAKPEPPPEPTLEININLTRQRMTVTENGATRYTWAISSGAYGYPTPTGTFRPSWMSKMWYSRQYDNAPMPHSIFFKGGAAIHATSSIHLLGTPASHGCVRLAPGNAARLYGMVGRHGKERTKIVVHGRPKYRAPEVARVQPGYRFSYGYSPYGYRSYAGVPPRYVYPGDSPRYYVKPPKYRNGALKKRRMVVREYYSGY